MQALSYYTCKRVYQQASGACGQILSKTASGYIEQSCNNAKLAIINFVSNFSYEENHYFLNDIVELVFLIILTVYIRIC